MDYKHYSIIFMIFCFSIKLHFLKNFFLKIVNINFLGLLNIFKFLIFNLNKKKTKIIPCSKYHLNLKAKKQYFPKMFFSIFCFLYILSIRIRAEIELRKSYIEQ